MKILRRLAAVLGTWPLLLCTALLLLNDLWFKAAAPGLVTGKLSDFAGIGLVAMLLLAIWPRRVIAVGIGLSLFFLWWKSPASGGFIGAANSLLPRPIGRVVDYTDLAALAVIPLAARVVRDPDAFTLPGLSLRRLLLVPTVAATLFGIMGTTMGINSQLRHPVDETPPEPAPSLVEPLYRPGHDLPRERLAQLLSRIAWDHSLRCSACASPFDGAEFANDEMVMTYRFPTPATLSVTLMLKPSGSKPRGKEVWTTPWYLPFLPNPLPLMVPKSPPTDEIDRLASLRNDLGDALAKRYPGLAWQTPDAR